MRVFYGLLGIFGEFIRENLNNRSSTRLLMKSVPPPRLKPIGAPAPRADPALDGAEAEVTSSSRRNRRRVAAAAAAAELPPPADPPPPPSGSPTRSGRRRAGSNGDSGADPLASYKPGPGDADKKSLRKAFAKFDGDGSGAIDPDEFELMLKVFGFGCSADEVSRLLEKYDKDHSGGIELGEFAAMLQELAGSRAPC